VFICVEQLASSIQHLHMTKDQQNEYEDFNRIATSAHLVAKCQCQKFKMGKVPWTPNLTITITRVILERGDLAGSRTLHQYLCPLQSCQKRGIGT